MADFGGSLLTSTTPITLRRPSFGNTNIPITLVVDNIAQEGTEIGILRMRISEDSEQPPGTFFRRDLRVTIDDTSSKFRSSLFSELKFATLAKNYRHGCYGGYQGWIQFFLGFLETQVTFLKG